MRRVTLEAALQLSERLGLREIVARAREVIHSDIEVAGARETPDGERHDLQLRLWRGQVGLRNPALRHEELRQVRVAVQGDAVGAELDHTVERAVEAVERLPGQTVDQVEVHRAEARR